MGGVAHKHGLGQRVAALKGPHPCELGVRLAALMAFACPNHGRSVPEAPPADLPNGLGHAAVHRYPGMGRFWAASPSLRRRSP